MKLRKGMIDNYISGSKNGDKNNNNAISGNCASTIKSNNINGSSKLFSVAELTSNLLLCGAGALRGIDLTDLKINCLISAAPELPSLPLPYTIKHHHLIGIRDSSKCDISLHLHRVADIIEQVSREGGKTLVHCVAGVSRSASLCIGYLVKYKSMTLRDAYYHVLSLRSCIRPNSGFFQQLIQFEKEIWGNSTVAMVQNDEAGGVIPDVYVPDYVNTKRYISRSIGIK